MSDATLITIPLLNPNEPEAQLAAVHVQPGQLVQRGDLLCTLETTKSTAELEAEAAGYVVGLHAAAGQTVRAGETLCYLADSPDWQPPAPPAPLAAPGAGPTDNVLVPAGVRITQPALTLARQLGLDFSRLPAGPLVTEKLVKELAQTAPVSPAVGFPLPDAPFDPTAIIIYGGGGHGKALIDLLRTLGTYRIVGIVDDGLDKDGTAPILGVPVLGGAEALPGIYQQGVRLAVNAVGGIGNVQVRIRVFQRLAQAGFACPVVVHPSAVIEPSARLAAGVQVFPHAYVGSEVQIGYGVIVNTGAIVSHECSIGDYANLSPGSILAGQVQVESGALVGMGATINLRARIGAGARIGNSATVKSDVPENGIVRAGSIWPAG